MPKKLDEIVEAVKRNLQGKVNPRTKKKYTESEIWAIAQTQYKKTKKSFEIYTPISKSWQEIIDKETGEQNRFIEVTVSGLKEDRDEERISKEAILDMMEQFKSGSIGFFPNHGRDPNTGERVYRWQDIMGVWVDATQVGDSLKAVVRLNEAHPEINQFWDYVKSGMPIGFSIGAKPLMSEDEEVEIPDDEDIVAGVVLGRKATKEDIEINKSNMKNEKENKKSLDED